MGRARGSPRRWRRAQTGRRRCGCATRTVWYSYATIRVVPRVERGEFLNVGVILFAREQDFLAACIELDAGRLLGLAPGLDVAVVERHLRTFADICAGDARG